LPAAGGMMSSSRVIKSSAPAVGAITGFNLQGLENRQAVDKAVPCDNGFVPYAGVRFADVPQITQTGNEEETDNSPEDDRVAEMELQLRVSEEEAKERVREAYEKGLEEGQRLAERGLSNVFKSLREAVEEVVALRERIFRESEEDLLKLSVLVAGTIIRQEIAQDRRILAKVMATALENSSEHDEIVIRLNPEDYKLVSSHKNAYLPGTGERKSFNLKPDETVSAGGCIVDTVMGEVDARLETQLEEIYKHMLVERGEIIGLPGNFRGDREQYAYEEN
jgi:flagellar assembly protein FliH